MIHASRIIICAVFLILPLTISAEDRFVHTDMFSVAVPDDFGTVSRSDGVILTEIGITRTLRRIEVIVSLQPVQTQVDSFEAMNIKGFDKPFLYTIDASDGGSGGTEYRLIAYGADDKSRAVMLIAHQQLELGRPDFDFAWDLLRGYQPN